MKQIVIDQMKEYQRKKEIVKAIKYQEGMEDGWLAECEEYRDDCETPRKYTSDIFFNTKSEAEKYNGCVNVVPVFLTEVSKEDYEDNFFAIRHDGKYYTYDTVNDDCWIILHESGDISTEYDTEDFNEKYELPTDLQLNDNFTAKIEFNKNYDLFVELNHKRINLKKSEVATVEKVLDALDIPYTEKLGEYLIWID